MTNALVPAALWFTSVALFWGVLAGVARLPDPRAVGVVNALFVAALPFTYLALVAGVVSLCANPRRARLRAAAVTLGLMAALGALELAAAIRLVHWGGFFKDKGGPTLYVRDPVLGFRHTPGIQVTGLSPSDIESAWGLPASASRPITLTYDLHGYRNPTPLSRADVVLIGDSHVEGAYVSDDEIVSRFLQARLGRPVANLGVAGYGTAQALILLKRDAVSLEPSVVAWFFYEGNDLYNDQDFENTLQPARDVRVSASAQLQDWWRRSFARAAHAQLRLGLYALVPRYYPHFGTLPAGPYRGQRILFGREAAYPWTEFEQERWNKARETLREATRFTREHRMHLLLLYVPTKFRVFRDLVEPAPRSELHDWTLWPLPEYFAELCRTEGLACLDLTGPLRDAVRNGGMPYAPVDSHWSAEGHRLIAERVADTLASFGWISPDGTIRR